MRANITILLFLLAGSISLKAQEDTAVLLQPRALGQEDIITPPNRQQDALKIISGTRFPLEAGDLPYSVYIITKEEIRQNGYETLVDALKMAPGFRVSQPGNAVEGETFLMRGLLGNTYTKILINDVPIKPVFVGGMPIGAQLPIKEAERIEVIYGAGSALYGADANAGVINIITRKSEKPVFMQADLNAGGGLYSSVNVMFGGRLGREKHIFNLFAYGSNVLLEQRPIFYDRDYNYNPENYFLLRGYDTAYVKLDNYRGAYNRPELTSTPHLSRKFGLSLNYRGITLSVESMYRRDHSALGLSPLAVSYANPLTFTGEGIWRVNLNFFKSKTNKNRKTDFTYLRYHLDDQSSVLHVQNDLSLQLKDAADFQAFRLYGDSAVFYAPQLFQAANARFLNGLRYFYGESHEGRFEHVRNYRILKRFSLTAGANIRVGGGVPVTELLTRPAKREDISYDIERDSAIYNPEVFPIAPVYRFYGEVNVYGQLFYNGKNLNLAAGINYSGISDLNEPGSSPRIAGLLKITERLRVRASWGRSFRAPSAYYSAASYRINSARLDELQRNFPQFDAEKTTSTEGGLRWYLKDYLRIDMTWFSNETSNLIRYGFNVEEFSDTALIKYLGYQTDTSFVNKTRGGQLHIRLSNVFRNNFLEAQYNLTWSKTAKDERIGIGLDELPTYAGLISQLRVAIRPSQKTSLILDGIWLSRADEQRVGGVPSSKVFTMDATARLNFNDRFNIYLKAINLLDKQYAGIRATGTPNDLFYNPQTSSFIRLGMNYFVE